MDEVRRVWGKSEKHLLQEHLPLSLLSLNHCQHVLVNSSGQVQVKVVWVNCHLTNELFVGEDAVTLQLTVMLHTVVANRDL